jgi:hypothetical protein
MKLQCDNEAVVAELEKSCIKRQAITPLLQIAMHVVLHNIKLHCRWIPIKKNLLPDPLSQWDTE